MFRSKLLGYVSIFLIWRLYHVISVPSDSVRPLQSAQFVKLRDREFVCSSDLVALTPEPGDHLACSRACQSHPDCPMFVFDSSSNGIRTTDRRRGTCLQCPADNIIAMNFTLGDPWRPESWQNVLGLLTNPPTDTYLAIPGALSVGRLVVIRGRIHEKPPKRIVVAFYSKNKRQIPVRVSPRFNYKGYKRCTSISRCLDGAWTVTVKTGEVFPFSAGQDFEISVLAGDSGFYIYTDVWQIGFLHDNKSLAGRIGYVKAEYAQLYTITY